MNVTVRDQIAPAVSPRTHAVSSGLVFRVGVLAALFVVELMVISSRLDTGVLRARGGFIGILPGVGPYALQSAVIFATVFSALAYLTGKSAFISIGEELAGSGFQWNWLGAHCAAMAAFAVLSVYIFGGARGVVGDVAAVVWLSSGVAGIAAGVLFVFPLGVVREFLRNAGNAWMYALAAAAAMPVFVIGSRSLWTPATAATFQLVKLFLRPFVSNILVDAPASYIGTQKFYVQISPYCSGIEGMGLMLVFGILWLAYFRRDYRFPQAFLLIPLSLGLIFLLNAVRITALILIGIAGAPNVAVGGFHSQAGWLAFNAVALGLACLAHRVPGISITTPARAISAQPSPEVRSDNPTAAYLVPFLAILAASMISTAASAGFEWLYPLRFIAAASALVVYRKSYANVDWRFNWAGPAIGVLVFLLWIGIDRVQANAGKSGIDAGLAALPFAARVTWLFFRTVAAVVTVPIAEELAFRGFLLRRLISADFDSVSLRRWTWIAVVASSVAFGMLHGNRWIAGTIAGILYALAQKWSGRTGEAVAAHATTNALIAVWVLWGGHWSLW